MFRSDVVFQLDRGGVLPLLKRPQSVRLALLVVIMILTWAMWRTGTGLYRARQRTQRNGDDDDRNHRGPRNSWFLMLHLFSFSSSLLPTQCDSKSPPSPICCMKDHTVPVSNQTTLAGARPLLCPHHPHLQGCQEGIINPATSTFRLVLGGATLSSTRTLVAVLSTYWWWCCAVWLAVRMLTSYVRRLALPLMAFAPHPPAVALHVYTVSTPVLRLMRRCPEVR